MQMNTLSISIHDDTNLGDRSCNPCDYFDELKHTPRWDAWDSDWLYSPSNLILGGGGLIHELLERYIRVVTRRKDRKLIAWGLGHNATGKIAADYKDTLDGFDLVGVRDYAAAQAHGWDYVPCASCMSCCFNPPFKYFGTFNYIIYQHVDHPITLRGADCPIPVMSNDTKEFVNVIDFLSSGHVVITNSFHGAYWAMLLGRKVIIYKPFSSRFYGFKYQPPFCDEKNWQSVEPLCPPPNFLEECRDLNRKFYAKVKDLLGIQSAGVADITVNTVAAGLPDSPVDWSRISEKPIDSGKEQAVPQPENRSVSEG